MRIIEIDNAVIESAILNAILPPFIGVSFQYRKERAL